MKANQYSPAKCVRSICLAVLGIQGFTATGATATPQTQSPVSSATARVPAPGEDPAVTLRAKRLIIDAINGNVPRSELSPAVAKEMTPQVQKQSMDSLAPFGELRDILFVLKTENATDTNYVYRIDFTRATLNFAMAVNKKTNLLDGFLFKKPSR